MRETRPRRYFKWSKQHESRRGGGEVAGRCWWGSEQEEQAQKGRSQTWRVTNARCGHAAPPTRPSAHAAACPASFPGSPLPTGCLRRCSTRITQEINNLGKGPGQGALRKWHVSLSVWPSEDYPASSILPPPSSYCLSFGHYTLYPMSHPHRPPCFCDGWLVALLEHSAWIAFPLSGASISSSNGCSLSLGFIPLRTQLRVWSPSRSVNASRIPHHCIAEAVIFLGWSWAVFSSSTHSPHRAWPISAPQNTSNTSGAQSTDLPLRKISETQKARAACGFFQVLHLAAEAASENTTDHLAAQIKILARTLILSSLSGSPHPNFWK